MNQYDFVDEYLDNLTKQEISSYEIPPGRALRNLLELQKELNLLLPKDLIDFYSFSYAPRFEEYKFLTFEEIRKEIDKCIYVYDEYWDNSMVPFSLLMGVGDMIVFNTAISDTEGTLIVDGFHEIPPIEWKPICYGLENWLREMVNNKFRPFWLDQHP
ncbi:MAG TPA: SMI1/KNR4 family protein [Anaerolineaceae bacterium]|nr:SMI1/KNR4 family protein [Anaerolineaceae bacterium]